MISIKYLKFPYPYQAALTISNDADLLSWESFKEIYNYFNTTRETKFGQGLGLSISSSLFFYSADQSSLSYFNALSDKKSTYAGALADLMKAGVIDTLHSYGDWGTYGAVQPGVGDFQRKHAEQVIEELQKNSIKLRVWTNHGHDNSVQNIGHAGKKRTYELGDNPASTAYHADLLDQYGVKFFWAESADIIGQETSILDLFRQIWQYPKSARVIKRGTLLRYLEKKNSLISRQICLDQKQRLFFLRYRGPKKAIIDNISAQLSPRLIDLIISLRGYYIVYTHFGVRMSGNNLVPNDPSWLPPEFTEAMRYLRDRSESGAIWVAPLADLLIHNYIVTQIKLHVVTSGQAAAVKMELKPAEEYLAQHLAGLSFVAQGPGHQGLTTLQIGDSPVALKLVQSGLRRSIYQVPLTKRLFPVI